MISIKRKIDFRVAIIVLVISLLFLSSIIILFHFLKINLNKPSIKMEACGDGTFSGTCSLSKPYYCDGEKLVTNISFCGCPSSLKNKDNNCSSKYYINSKEKTFDYFLNGKKGKIKLILYGGIANYTNNLPKSILYSKDDVPKRRDFKFLRINNNIQKEALMPLLIKIQNLAPNSKEDQAKIAISLVQEITYSESKFTSVLGQTYRMRIARYPYQVLYGNAGSCEGKSELLSLLLKEIGYGTSLFYYQKENHEENHEAVGIKCPNKESLKGSGYCFVETTMPSPISYSEGRYLGIDGSNKLLSSPEIMIINNGIALSKNLDEYSDAKTLTKIMNKIDENGKINILEKRKLDALRKKYNLLY